MALVPMRLLLKSLIARGIILLYAIVAGTIGISTVGMVQFFITTLPAPFPK